MGGHSGDGGMILTFPVSPLLAWLTGSPSVYVFGGLVKHIINGTAHPTYSDIDVIATSPAVIAHLDAAFGYRFKEVSRADQNPRYLLGKSADHDKLIQLILVRSHEEVKVFINNAQYDIDRVSISNHRLHFDTRIGLDAIARGINDKQARRIKHMRDMRFFAPHRQQIEQRHKLKLLRKGFVVMD